MSDKHATLENRDGFQSKWGFILACIGSAVGMGNIWRFPIMVQQFGGMTFLIPYFLFVLLIGSTGIIEEFALGRWAQGGPVIAFGKATEERTGNKRLGEAIGALPIIGSMMLAIGYTVVMSWIFKYCWMGISGSLYAMGTDMATIGGTFGGTAPEAETLGEALGMMFGNGIFGIGNGVWLIVGLVASLAIMAFGVGNGIEKANKVMMPALFFLFVILGIYICTLPGASEGYKYIFSLDLRGLLDVNVWVFAFGQCFFSLSVAGSGSVIYGSYLGKDVKIRQSAILCALFDTSAALLAMFIVIPAMATTGADLGNGGPGLMFIYLIPVFNNMGGIARIMFIFFYVAVLFAGLSSIINLFETPVAFLQEKLHFNRVTATAVIHIIGVAIALTIQPWTSQWMDMVSIYLCPLGALTAGIMFFWIMKKDTALAAVQEGDPKPVMHWFLSFGKYVFVPLCAACFILGIVFGGIG